MNSHTIAVIVTGCLFVIFMVFERRRYQQKSPMPAAVFKGLTSAGFIATAFAVNAVEILGGPYLIGSLVLCLIGDLLLTSLKQTLFKMGIFSFLLGHVGYTIFFAILGLSATALAVAIPVLCVVGGLIYRWLHPHVKKEMRIPVIAYVIVICTMVSVAVATFGAGSSILFPIAAIVFMSSDVLVARERFIKSEFRNRLYSMPTYYAAQLIFASSPLFVN